MSRAVDGLLDSDNRLHPVVQIAFGEREPTCKSQPKEYQEPTLNASQASAIAFAEQQNEVAIIHGYVSFFIGTFLFS